MAENSGAPIGNAAGGLVAGIALVAAAVTNPDLSKFRLWAVEQAGPIVIGCQSSQRSNWVVASTYRLRCGRREIDVLGVYGNFVSLDGEVGAPSVTRALERTR